MRKKKLSGQIPPVPLGAGSLESPCGRGQQKKGHVGTACGPGGRWTPNNADWPVQPTGMDFPELSVITAHRRQSE